MDINPQTDTLTYEQLVTIGIDLRTLKDGIQWQLGDLGAYFVPNPTQGVRLAQTLTAFANDINMKPRTLQEYTQCAIFYPQEVRENYPNLSYSHFRTALRFADKELPIALAFLEHASLNGLTCDAFEVWLIGNRESIVKRLERQLVQVKMLLKEIQAQVSLPSELQQKVMAIL